MNGKRCLDDMDDENGEMVEMYGGMVDDGSVEMVEIKSKLGVELATTTARWGHNSKTGKSRVIRSKKMKTKIGLNEIIEKDVMKISNYFLLEGINSQGR